MIANKLVNYASEISGKMETSIFKQLASGEPVEARLPYGNPFTISRYAKLIFNCNELPRDVEQTEAYFRRFLIIPFSVKIPESEQDKQLAQKIIENELPGIFNWVLDGLKRLLEQKQFTESETVRNMREQYEIESDSVKLFIHENGYKPSAETYKDLQTLYIEYRLFCTDSGFRPVSKTNLKKRLESINIIVKRRSRGHVVFIENQDL
jgi:putative DNA primase/helicase